MELCVSTTPRVLFSLPRRPTPAILPPSSSISLFRQRRGASRGLRCTNADWPEPVAPDEPPAAAAAAATVVVTDKPDADAPPTPEEPVTPPASEEKPKAARKARASAAASEKAAAEDIGVVSSGSSAVVEEAAVSFAASEEQGSAADSGGAVLRQALGSKLDFEETSTYVVYGAGAFVAGWVLSAIVAAIDSIPLFPKVLEIVGLGYTIWFSSRYLLFKNNRDELFGKIDDLKQQILGSDDE